MSLEFKTKDKVFGGTIRIKELIDVLENGEFDDDAPIQVNTEKFSGEVTAIYKCKARNECNQIHILANNFTDTTKYAFEKSDIAECLASISDKVYGFQTSINKGDLLKIIKSLDKESTIVIETMADEYPTTLTGVLKCSDSCKAIHLTSKYEFYDYRMN